ncbi:regulatory protein RecX [Microbacterium sp.]|uniref:regulatory protein RecX n=1 Tax=Microbacterium sp. TaxID=51671 RepID=UPI00289CA10C|nr:regulatory protein RecX [Microbacterium sp.]
MTPLFGGRVHAAPAEPAETPGDTWHTTWTEPVAEQALEPDEIDVAADAESALVKRLRTRSLSEREARAFLRERDLSVDAVEGIIEGMLRHGYLDDARLAEQLIHAATTRKGQGRRAISQALSQRGIPRDVVDAALETLPDDDADRALEYARQKARTMRDLDRETALRRLSGQLARRGYGGQSLEAARRALDELSSPTRSGVRFEP